MRTAEAIGSGLAGAVTLTLLHESVKRFVPDAPRMDLIGMSLVKKATGTMGPVTEHNRRLYNQALAGDLFSNSLFYSMAGTGRNAWWRGSLLGLGAGLAAVLLPRALGEQEEASSRNATTIALTLGMYTLAGVAAAAVGNLLSSNSNGRIENVAQEVSNNVRKAKKKVRETVNA